MMIVFGLMVLATLVNTYCIFKTLRTRKEIFRFAATLVGWGIMFVAVFG